jgi:uncharacterized membrane protein
VGDELSLFYAFTAVSQIAVGTILLVVGGSTATQIIGIVVVVIGLLTGFGPVRALWRNRPED